jgi:CelD/BcsL family acetyltransferase involved in cellulose biosynthesis
LLLTDEPAFQRLDHIWRELWERTEPRPPMLELRWVQEWWRLQREHGRLFVVVVLGDGSGKDQSVRRPVGLAPLYLRDEGVRDPRRCLRTVAFLGTGEREEDELTGEYTTWLGAPEVMPRVTAQVAGYLHESRGAWDRVHLLRMCPEPAIADHLALRLADVTSERHIESVATFRSPVLPLEAFVAAVSSSSFRHRCRRALRAGKEEGVEFVRATDATQRAAMFEGLQALHQQRWGDRGHKGVFASPLFTRFQEAIREPYAAEDRLWLVGLRKGERWLAIRYHLRAGDTLYDYVSGVDTTTSTALAPGLLLHLHTIDACAKAGIKSYDLMAGDYDYKRKLAGEAPALPTLDLFGRTARARLWLAARDLGRNLKAARDRIRPPTPATPDAAGDPDAPAARPPAPAPAP